MTEPTPQDLLALLREARDAIKEAMDVHIYNKEDGETPEPDCGYTALVNKIDAALPAEPRNFLGKVVLSMEIVATDANAAYDILKERMAEINDDLADRLIFEWSADLPEPDVEKDREEELAPIEWPLEVGLPLLELTFAYPTPKTWEKAGAIAVAWPKTKSSEAFEYFEIRACVEHDGATHSFLGPLTTNEYDNEVHTPEGAKAEAEAFREAHDGAPGDVFWTIYGMEGGMARAIGDFDSFEAAYEVMNAIIAPMAKARDLIAAAADCACADKAANDLDDFINQCSNTERL